MISAGQSFGLFFQELGVGILAMLPLLSPREIGWKFFRMQGGIAVGLVGAGILAAGGWRFGAAGAHPVPGISTGPLPGILTGPLWDSATAALLAGSVLVAMILGHWYLVVPKLSFGHLRTMTAVFIGAIVARLAVVAALLWRVRAQPMAQDPLWWALVSMRVLFGIVTPLVLSYMIWECVKLRSNQSATGILYAATVLVLMGEISSCFLGV